MTTFIFSLDLFEKLDIKYYNSILYQVMNHHNDAFCVAIDNEERLIEEYKKVCKYGDFFNIWLQMINRLGKDEREQKIVPLNKEPIGDHPLTDKKIYLLTENITVFGQKFMVIHSTSPDIEDIPNCMCLAKIIDFVEADDVINNKNNIFITAEGGSTVKNNNFYQQQ